MAFVDLLSYKETWRPSGVLIVSTSGLNLPSLSWSLRSIRHAPSPRRKTRNIYIIYRRGERMHSTPECGLKIRRNSQSSGLQRRSQYGATVTISGHVKAAIPNRADTRQWLRMLLRIIYIQALFTEIGSTTKPNV